MLTTYESSRSIVPTFSKQQITLFLTRDMGGIGDFEYIILLKSEMNAHFQIEKSFQDVILTVMFIGLQL